ncbi:lysozyme inhibitor LprI family protein [Novosphingobium rosa]|uniref:lysozyme inhibitor LprI family protein n=1 Tax=Novosphingobium rosa TaxID=76978 RepID=UPI00082D1D8D|nr:hypothetical protein [Novosphingobium rosa]
MQIGRIIAALLLAFGAAPVQAQTRATSSGPSFACTAGQGGIEAVICASPTLSAADREMAALYAANKVSAFGSGPSNQLVDQREAVKAMQACAKPSGSTTIAACLQGAYDERNKDLAIAAATRAPDLALPVIRRLDPAFAPVAEAIVLWSSEPDGADWSAPERVGKRARIVGLLQPVLTDFLTRQDPAFARGMLDSATGEGVVKRAGDLLGAPDRFVGFLNVLGPALAGDGSVGTRNIPCAAIVAHPKLLGATDSIYGATPDTFVFNTDCRASLPPLPLLTALDGKVWKTWPICDGTIRFAAYRQYRSTVDEARLGLARHDPKLVLPAVPGVPWRDMTAARRELAAYYIRYLGKTQAQAAQMATDALAAMLNAAHECD